MKAFIQHKDSEGEKMVVQALVPFVELKNSAVFTCKTDPNKRNTDKQDLAKASYEYYQRRIDLTRISEIEKFIINSILDEKDNVILATLFPTSMILAINDDDNGKTITDDTGDDLCKITLNQNVFIVDGQHRLMAMLRVYDRLEKNSDYLGADTDYVKTYIERYKFNCTILVNYDLWEQGQVFVNVNFKQKPVNKSLYYEVFGSEYRESKKDWTRNKIYLAHWLAKSLNERKESPYYQKVKMLGTGSGYISQAFIVETLMVHFNKYGIWDYATNNPNLESSDYSFFATELLSYFYALKEMFQSYWPEPDSDKGTVICKTTGFFAFCQLMKVIRSTVDDQLIKSLKRSTRNGTLCEDYIGRVYELFKPIKNEAENLFGGNSKYRNNSGKAAQVELRNKLLSIIGLDKAILKVNNDWSDSINLTSVVEKLYDTIDEYVSSNVISEVDVICNHYETDGISNLQLLEIERKGTIYLIKSKFNIDVILYLDNTDDVRFPMSFPSSCTAELKFEHGEMLIPKLDSLKVDVSKYYQ